MPRSVPADAAQRAGQCRPPGDIIIPVERYALVYDVPVRKVAPRVMGMGLAGGLGSRWRWCRMGGCSDERESINRR